MSDHAVDIPAHWHVGIFTHRQDQLFPEHSLGHWVYGQGAIDGDEVVEACDLLGIDFEETASGSHRVATNSVLPLDIE